MKSAKATEEARVETRMKSKEASMCKFAKMEEE